MELIFCDGNFKKWFKVENYKISPEVNRKWVEEKSHIDLKNVRAVSEKPRTKVRLDLERRVWLRLRETPLWHHKWLVTTGDWNWNSL